MIGGGGSGGRDLPNPKTSARAGAPHLGAVTNSKSHLAAKLNILRLDYRWCCKQPGTFFSSLFHGQKKVPYFVVAVLRSRTYVRTPSLYNVHRFVNNNVHKNDLANLINRFHHIFIKSVRDYNWESV